MTLSPAEETAWKLGPRAGLLNKQLEGQRKALKPCHKAVGIHEIMEI